MNKIQVNQITQFCLSEQEGKHLRETIIGILKNYNSVTVDFSGLSLFASPFFNASLGYLVSFLGVSEYQNKICVTNLLPTGQKIYDKVFENVVEYSKAKNKSEIDDIVSSIDD